MYVIDRAVALIKPKQPYLDWTNSLPDPTPVTLEQLRKDCSVILVPASGLEEAARQIRKDYALIFEMELDSWRRDPERWPAKRDYKTFTEWFDVEIYDMVIDFGKDEIAREDY